MVTEQPWGAAWPRAYDKGFLSAVWTVRKKQPEKTPALGTAGVAGAPRKAGEVPHRELPLPKPRSNRGRWLQYRERSDVSGDTEEPRGASPTVRRGVAWGQPYRQASREGSGTSGPGEGLSLSNRDNERPICLILKEVSMITSTWPLCGAVWRQSSPMSAEALDVIGQSGARAAGQRDT